MKTSVPQVLEEVEKSPTREAKIKVLRAYDHVVVRGLLRINFDENIKMSLPEGEPPFKKDTSIPAGYSETNLFTEFRRFYIWLNNDVNITQMRKEQLFIQMLEGIHWSEAELICLAKDKKIQTKYKSIKEDLIREAYPELMPPKAIQIKPEEQKAKSSKKKASLDAS
jgi:Family of unknown function (DUF6433)